MSIIREEQSRVNDSIHEVIKDIEERGTAYGLPNIGMYESIGFLSIKKKPVKTVSLMPEDLHAFSWDQSKDELAGVVIYTRTDLDTPHPQFKKVLTISLARDTFTLSRLSLAVAGYFFFVRNWFDDTEEFESETKIRIWADRHWPDYADDLVSLVKGLCWAWATERTKDGSLPESFQQGIFTFS